MDNDIGLKQRELILTYALLLEFFTSIFLAQLLGIKDREKTISFGNKNSALSFNQKINLLIDIKALSKENKNKYQTFMEVRNQFMHNFQADSFETCYSFIEGKANFVLRLYPQSEEFSKEEQLKKATLNLSEELLNTTIGLIDKVKEKYDHQINEYRARIKELEG
jgi:hypothetical protein